MGRIETDFSDKTLRCENRHVIGYERLDRQILMVGDVGIYNFCRLVCMRDGCGSVVEFAAPNLSNKDDINYLSDIPKPKKLRHSVIQNTDES